MKQAIAVMSTVLAFSSLDACGSSTPEGTGGNGGSTPTGSGGISASGGTMGTGGLAGTGGAMGSGGVVGSGGKLGTGGQSAGGASGTGTGLCPFTVASFSCEAACKKLHDIYGRCQNDPTISAEMQAMLGLYGQVEVICTSTCAVVAPASQAQWACFQGVPDDAPCSAIAGCNMDNCP
jgi:hypothetical protein